MAGAMLIALACMGVGVTEVRRLSADERLWRDWVQLLEYVHSELRYTVRPIQEILAQADINQYAALGWLREFDGKTDICMPVRLSAGERAYAEGFFGFVGTSDLQGQLAHIAQYTERAKERLKTASERRQRLARVYLSTAVCAGLCIGIVML